MSDLSIVIEDLLEKNAADFEIAKAIKKEIKEYLSSLDDIFNESQGKDFFVKHTKKIDTYIKIMYKYLLRKHFLDFTPLSNSVPITLVALGSYGREQLCVYSDIDIMILYKDIPAYNLKPIMEELVLLAWDSGLKLGSRVHEISEVEEVVKTDITIKTAIIESRFIYGSKILWFGLQRSLINIQKCDRREFILEKYQEHKDRLLKYPLRMEPNIKDGYGGMRESNMLYWVANVIYGVHSTKDLIGEIFTEEEYKAYRISLEYIFRVRNALHLIAKKKLDQVNFDVLPELSSRLGFVSTPKLVKERQCMSKLFESLHTIHLFSSSMIKRMVKPYLYKNENLSILRQSRIKKDLYLVDGMLYSSFNRKPITFLRFIKELNELPIEVKKFDISYIDFAKKIKLPHAMSKTHKNQVKSLLEKENLYPIMKMLYNADLFVKILPSMKKIINQPQFDGFHIHPVDVHTLKALKYTHEIKDRFVKSIYDNLDKRQKSLLNLCILFHDVGKGRTKDHHIVSEDLFKKFARSFNLKEEDTLLVARIIRYHNQVSYVATREDIYSQKVISNFNALLQTKEALDILTCITYGDINSVASNIYKSATASLVKELYLQSVNAFDNVEMLKESTRRIRKQNTIINSKAFKELPKMMQKKILAIESNQLFLTKKASEIINLGVRANGVATKEFAIFNGDVLSIRILRLNPLNLGYLLGKLSFLDLAGMNIFKLYDDKKYFEMWFSENVSDEEIPFIKEIVNNSFDMSLASKIKKPTIQRKDIFIDCDHRDDVALMKISTQDQKGLFAYIAKVLDDFNIDIESAKIYTSKGKANDLLLIHKNGNFCTNKEKIIEDIVSS